MTICSRSGRVIMPPNIPIPTITPSTVVSVKVRLLNSFSGKIASSPAARSAKMKAVIPIALKAYIEIASGLPQPQSRPLSATRSIGTTPITMVSAPSQSILWLTGVCGT